RLCRICSQRVIDPDLIAKSHGDLCRIRRPDRLDLRWSIVETAFAAVLLDYPRSAIRDHLLALARHGKLLHLPFTASRRKRSKHCAVGRPDVIKVLEALVLGQRLYTGAVGIRCIDLLGSKGEKTR